MAKSKTESNAAAEVQQDIELTVPADLTQTEEYKKLQKLVEERKQEAEQVLSKFVGKLSKDTSKKFRSYEHLVKFIIKAKKSKKKK